MIKISTLFIVDYPTKNTKLIKREVRQSNAWVYTDTNVIATRKFDGSACAILGGELYKRYDAKQGKAPPTGAIPCQDPDETTGHWPHWLKCLRTDPADKYFFEAFDLLAEKTDGTYELCGPKIKLNPERFENHVMVRHGQHLIEMPDFEFDTIKEKLFSLDIEGIVFHGRGGKMCKIRKSDFGFKR